MKTIKRLICLSLFMLTLMAAQTILHEALQLYKTNTLHRSPEAVEALQREAEAGNADAAFLLATAYKNGKAGPPDEAKAFFWYRKAAELGDADAMLMLGWLYYKHGGKSAVDLTKARYWFKKSAELGIDEAVEMLELLESGFRQR